MSTYSPLYILLILVASAAGCDGLEPKNYSPEITPPKIPHGESPADTASDAENAEDNEPVDAGLPSFVDAETVWAPVDGPFDGDDEPGNGGGDPDTEQGPPADGCVPDCNERTCGDDGCGSLCGVCAQGESCNQSGQCEPPANDCEPRCGQHSCGDNGCGGTCGECAGDSTCDVLAGNRLRGRACHAPEYAADNNSTSCPPDESRFGIEPGDVVPETALVTCEGHFPVNHRGMCSNNLSLTYQLNVDCAPCVRYVNEVLGPLQEAYGEQGLKTYVVYDDPAECSTMRLFRNYADQLEFVYQPSRFGYSLIFSFGGRSTALLMGEGNELIYYGKGDSSPYSGPSPDQLTELIESNL